MLTKHSSNRYKKTPEVVEPYLSKDEYVSISVFMNVQLHPLAPSIADSTKVQFESNGLFSLEDMLKSLMVSKNY